MGSGYHGGFGNTEGDRREKINNIVYKAIKNKVVKDEINKEKQLRHLEKSRIEGRSYLYGDLETAKKLYDKLKGTGIPINSEKGWTRKERVKSNCALGIYNDSLGNKIETKSAMIIYSKTGSHMYPIKEEL